MIVHITRLFPIMAQVVILARNQHNIIQIPYNLFLCFPFPFPEIVRYAALIDGDFLCNQKEYS